MSNLLQELPEESILQLIEAANEYITIDTEGFPTMVGFSLCADGFADGLYVPIAHASGNWSAENLDRLYGILHNKTLIMHNALHDLRVLARNGFVFKGKFFDTMLMAHWINEERPDYSLNAISKVYGGKPKAMPPAMSVIIESDGWNAVPVGMMTEYSGNDAYIEHVLFHKLLEEFERQGFLPAWEVEQAFIREAMGPMIDIGVKVDVEFCVKEIIRGSAIMDSCKDSLGIDPGSRKDLEKLLIEELKLPIIKRTPKGAVCFDKHVMAEYDFMLEKNKDPRAQLILTYRGWQKTIGANYQSYLKFIDDNDVLHPGYTLHRTRTGRLACSDPALQQIPKDSDKDWNGKSKSAFIARPGFKLWTVDYSQLQFRMTCAYANQRELLEIFNDRSRDIFSEMAKQMGWIRDNVKTLVYLILFGGGANRAKAAFGLSTVDEGKILVEEFHTLYSEIRKVSRQAQNFATKHGYVRYWTGRRRHFPKGSAFYRAFNAVIQGGEAEIMKRAMIALQREVCDDNCRMILQIHDELAFEIAEGKESYYLPLIQAVMERVPKEFCEFVGVDVDFPTQAKAWGEK